MLRVSQTRAAPLPLSLKPAADGPIGWQLAQFRGKALESVIALDRISGVDVFHSTSICSRDDMRRRLSFHTTLRCEPLEARQLLDASTGTSEFQSLAAAAQW